MTRDFSWPFGPGILGATRPYFQHVGAERGQGTMVEEGKTGPSSRDEVEITKK